MRTVTLLLLALCATAFISVTLAERHHVATLQTESEETSVDANENGGATGAPEINSENAELAAEAALEQHEIAELQAIAPTNSQQSAADDDEAPSEDGNDWVGDIIDNLRAKIKSHGYKAGGAKITLVDNSNTAHHTDFDVEKPQEMKLKASVEELHKQQAEQSQKREDEQSAKKAEDNSKARIVFLKNRLREQQKKQEIEQDKKAAVEQNWKGKEATVKMANEAKAKADLAKARTKTAEANTKAMDEMEKKRDAEQNQKRTMEETNKKEIKDAQAKAEKERQAQLDAVSKAEQDAKKNIKK